MFGLGFTEILVILVVALLVFGPDRLPELARNLGKGLAEFRRASSDLRRSVMEATEPSREPSRPDAKPAVLPPNAGPADEMANAPLAPAAQPGVAAAAAEPGIAAGPSGPGIAAGPAARAVEAERGPGRS